MTRAYETLVRILEILADANLSKLVLVHHNGDPDAVGSAIALQAVFPNVRIGAPLGLSRTGRRLADACEVEVLERPRVEDHDETIIVDTSNPVQLGEFAKRLKRPIIIDHHAYHDDWSNAKHLYVDSSKASCCEVIESIIERADEDGYTDFSLRGSCPDVARLETVGLALLTGIWTDSAGFRFAHPETFQVTARLMTATGTSMTDVLEVLEGEPEFAAGKREAHLKAAQRLTYRDVGGLSVVTSHVSSYEASAARALTMIGADVAFCVADNKEEIRASARARRKAVDERGIHLGHLMNRVGKELGFMGGGHSGAAGMNLPKSEARARGVEVPTIEATIDALLAGLEADLAKPPQEGPTS